MSYSVRRALALILVLTICAVFWRILASTGLLTPESLQSWIDQATALQSSPWLIPAIVSIYALSMLVMFPLTVLVVTTGLLFGPIWGLLYATLGTLCSSALSYWVGRLLGREAVANIAGERMQKLSAYLADRGIRTMAVINLLPIAPFTVTNMLAGAFNFTFSRYMIGSTLGIVPGLIAVTILGSQLSTILLSQDWQELLGPVLVAAGCLAALAVLVQTVRRHLTQSD